MKDWIYVTFITCAYGGLKSIHPTTHFLTQYLEGPWVNLTHSQVNNEVYPVWTYAYLCFLPATFLLIIFVRHKPIIILESICLVATWSLLIWVRTLWAVQLMQVVYGLATASEVGYDTYIYAKVPRSKYRQTTSHTRAAVLVGRVLSAIFAQTLISTQVLDYHGLCYVSLAFSLCSAIFAFLLPATDKSGLETDCVDNVPDNDVVVKEKANSKRIGKKNDVTQDFIEKTSRENPRDDSNIIPKLYFQMKTLYSKRSLVQWSLWWALGMCGGLQVGNYIQTLWEDIYPVKENRDLYNGAVDAVKTLLGVIVTLGLGYVNVDWSRYGEMTLGLMSVLDACLLFVMSQTDSIWVSYGTNCIFRASHQMLITIASYQVAKESLRVNQPLIFGCNTFLALIFQTVLTAIVVDKRALGLEPRIQFLVYCGYFIFIGVLFLTLAIGRMCYSYSYNNDKPKASDQNEVQNHVENTQSV